MLALYNKLHWIEQSNLLEDTTAEWIQIIHSSSRLYSTAGKDAPRSSSTLDLSSSSASCGQAQEGGESALSSSSTLITRSKKVIYCTDILHSHCFARTMPPCRQSRAWLRELNFIEDNLPDEVSLFPSDEQPNCLVASMHMVNPDCPYYGGVFLFHLFVPAEYPSVAPKVQLVTTGDGLVRFNPNLYKCGKVCLSLLGTWAGEPWSPQTSNVTQVLKSILYLIFTEDPFFNEPGYQSSRGTPSGRLQSLEYDWDVLRSTVQYAILYHLQKPVAHYGEHVSQCIRTYLKNHWEQEIRGALEEKYQLFQTQLSPQSKSAYPATTFRSHMQQISQLVASSA
jgi:ubiquitin-protein ligase